MSSKSIESKTNSKYLIGTKFDEAIRQLVLTMPKMSRYVTTFKVKNRDKDKKQQINDFLCR